jgi:hypothetical protein
MFFFHNSAFEYQIAAAQVSDTYSTHNSNNKTMLSCSFQSHGHKDI